MDNCWVILSFPEGGDDVSVLGVTLTPGVAEKELLCRAKAMEAEAESKGLHTQVKVRGRRSISVKGIADLYVVGNVPIIC